MFLRLGTLCRRYYTLSRPVVYHSSPVSNSAGPRIECPAFCNTVTDAWPLLMGTSAAVAYYSYCDALPFRASRNESKYRLSRAKWPLQNSQRSIDNTEQDRNYLLHIPTTKTMPNSSLALSAHMTAFREADSNVTLLLALRDTVEKRSADSNRAPQCLAKAYVHVSKGG